MPQAWIQKFNDRISSGIPDAVVVYEGRATWLEFKVGQRAVTMIQVETLRRLQRGYVVRWRNGKGSHRLIFLGPYRIRDGSEVLTFNELVENLEIICKTS
jgi:hypothetical protein